MKIKNIEIEGYKSIGNISIVQPNPFTVFVGPNASGKSNIFEVLEFLTLGDIMQPNEAIKLFGNPNDVYNQSTTWGGNHHIQVSIQLNKVSSSVSISSSRNKEQPGFGLTAYSGLGIMVKGDQNNFLKENSNFIKDPDYINFFNFTRLFVDKKTYLPRNDDSKLNTDASNLEKVLKRILKNENIREEIMEILHLLIPGFSKVEIATEPLSGNDTLLVYEDNLTKPLTKNLISDGTYNILAIIAALYQSNIPQFLCIEEPENGLNPFVVKELVAVIRDICDDKGHYIWLNTHSQTLVSELTAKEIIIVEKKNGLTQIKQIEEKDLHGLRMDDALYTNVIGGGNPW